ncbi:MAG: PKD domain-containing protein, partial [Vicingaceae bacterium]
MSKLLRLLTIFAFFLTMLPSQVFATHIMGGEITWECLADGRYIFRFSVYRDCSGTALDPRGPLTLFNYPNVGSSTLLIAGQNEYNNNPLIDRDISPECKPGGVTYSCAAGDDESVFEYVRESDPIRLNGTPPPQGWIITYDDVARNDNDNIAGQPGVTLRAKIFPFSGSVADTCVDNSPRFREEATSLLCLGSSFTYNHNASDVELDSLAYSWARPLNAVNTSNPTYNEGSNPTFVGYDPGYSFNNPFPGPAQDSRNVPATLDSQTGEISLTSYTSGKYVSVVQVTAYKCGEKVAEIYRELQSNIAASCSVNEPPTLRPPFQDNNGNFTRYQDTVRAGDLVTFNLQITDFPGPNNPNSDSVFVFASGFQWGDNFTNASSGCANPPCATLSSPLPDSGLFAPPNKTFSWQTDCNHVAFTDGCVSLENTYNFVFRATDDACPIPGQTIATVSITVLADSVIESPLLHCVDVQPNGDVQLDWNTTPDPNNSFTAWMIYSATNQNGPYTIVDSVKTYNQTTYTHSGAGADNQRRWYYIRSRSGCKGIVQNVARDTVSTLFVQPRLDQSCVGISWNSLSNPNPSGSANSYQIFREYPIGTGMNFLQNSSVEAFCDNFTACEDSVAYRIDLVNSTEGCTSRSNVIGFRFNRKPQTNFTVPGNTCSGPVAFTNLTTAQGGNLSYTWDFGDGSPTSSQTNPSHTFTGIGPFTVSLTASSGPGCDSTFVQQVTLGPDADAGPDVAICPGGSVGIGGSPTTTALNATYQWLPSASLNNASDPNPIASPASNTTYTVTVTDVNGCTNTDQVTVSVNTVPTANAGSDITICEGTTATLGGSPTGPSGATFQWDNAGTLNNASDPNPIASPTITTVYTVTVSNGVNCTATDQITVTVNPEPTADAGVDQTICPGGSVQIGGSPTSSTPGALFTWNNGASLSNASASNPLASPGITTTYTLTVTHTNGCTNTDQVTVNVNPQAAADAGSDQTICVGESVSIGGAPTGAAGSTYAWNNAATLSSGSAANPSASPVTTTTYTVTVTDGNGCTNTDQVTVNVNSLPNADAGPDQSACPGATLTLGGSNVDPVGTTYSWSPSANLSSTTVKNPTLTVVSTQTYTVTVTAPGTGCTATDQVTITAFPSVVPDAGSDQTICNGESIQIGGTSSGGSGNLTFSWNNGGSLSSTSIQNPIASPTATTIYTLTVTDQNNCTAVDQLTVNVNNNPTADAGSDVTICEGSTTTLGGTPTGPSGSTYSWNNGATLSSTSAANPTASPTVTTTYSVTVTSGVSCTSVDQITVTV